MNRKKESMKDIAEKRGRTVEYVAKFVYGHYVKDRRIEAVKNYEKALADSFDGWVLHHLLESEHTAKDLIKMKKYYYADPSELVWLTEDEHRELHREIAKIPWRVELEKKRRQNLSKAMLGKRKAPWPEERKERVARKQRELWNDERREHYSRIRKEKRENGDNKVNVAQLDGPDGYREYQKLYQQLYYDEHKTEWKNYLQRRTYAKMSTDELICQLEKKKKNRTWSEEKKARLIGMIKDELKIRMGNEPIVKYERSLDMKSVEEIREEIERLNRELKNRGL